jgi:uncharacterized protein
MGDPVLTLSILASATLLATVVQTLAGFGFALLMMPIVTLFLGLHVAAPLVALTALTLYAWNTLRYHAALNLREIWPLAGAAIAGVPVGIWAVARASEALVKGILGWLLIAYAVQGLLRPRERKCSSAWAPLAGFLAGCLGGAYNTSGPPLAVYGALRGWSKTEFRAGIQALFLCSGVVTVLSHALTRHITPSVLLGYAATPPLLAAGLIIGGSIDRYVDKERFRTVVMAMILLLGVMLTLHLGQR